MTTNRSSIIDTYHPTERFIVVLGASAGGLEAIHDFFDHMPANTGFTFVVIQHLSPDHKSLLVELVGKHTHMKVMEAVNGTLLEKNCVYIIPSKKMMTIRHRKLRLEDKIKDRSPNTAIDTFLVTLANDVKDKAIAIILSGTGTDGSKGIEAIKQRGGMVIVQDPATAKFDGMPRSAIESGNTDFVLAPSKMKAEIYNYVKQLSMSGLEKELDNDEHLNEIFHLVSQKTGHDFNLYKTPTILRRIARRIAVVEVPDLPGYLNYIKSNPDESSILSKEFLIGVTKFFRDQAAFEEVKTHVIPEIIRSKNDGDTIKIWVCACSTGEEAYSLAINFHEQILVSGKELDLKVFATDLDEGSIKIASKNHYPAAAVRDINAGTLQKYFTKNSDGTFSVNQDIRKKVVFAAHNVIKSPPFIKNDMISCRNMLIYMNAVLQQKVLSTFHYSLCPSGFLFLGQSENASSLKDGLVEISNKFKVYQRTGNIKYELPKGYTTSTLTTQARPGTPIKEAPVQNTVEQELLKLLTGRLAYVGVFIDKNFTIRETLGDFTKYLSLPQKRLELNLLNMVSREVSILLSTTVRKSWKDNEIKSFTGINDDQDADGKLLQFTVKPPDELSPNGYTLILFSEINPEIQIKAVRNEDLDQLNTRDEYLMEMESTLSETKANLQLALEEMETTNEELQSSNEELMSANEELQSGNEELQSLNEELHTLNAEHQQKIRELVELNEDLDNYFRSTNIGQIFIDANLLIRKFNPAALSMVNLIESDVGRPINHISNNINYPDLNNDIHSVLASNTVIEKEIGLNNGSSHLMRVMPYLKHGGKIDGVVISFIDITTITKLNNMVSGVFNASASGIMAFQEVYLKPNQPASYRCIAYNEAAGALFHGSDVELKDQPLLSALPQFTELNLAENIEKILINDQPYQTELQLVQPKWHYVIIGKMAGGFVISLTDITKRKVAEQKLKGNYNELIRTRESLRLLNQDLETKVAERTKALSESEERFKFVSEATNDTIWDWNLVTNDMWRSDNFKTMFGYELNARTNTINFWLDCIHPDDRQRVESSVFQAIDNGEDRWSSEYRFKKADENYAMILDRASILKDQTDMPHRLVGSVIDITRLNDAEKKLSSSERKFAKVFDSNMIGMLFSTFEGKINEANDAFLKMLGYVRKDLEDGILDWKNITPEAFLNVSYEAVQQLKLTGVCPPFEKEYIKKDGQTICVLMGSAVLDQHEETSVVSYVIDITKEKEAERNRQRLQQQVNQQQKEFSDIFSDAPALIAIKRGKDLDINFSNYTFQDYFGKDGYQCNTFSSEKMPEAFNVKETESSVYLTGKVFELKQVKAERSVKGQIEKGLCWLDIIITPVFNYKGCIDGVAFFGSDVTDMVLSRLALEDLMHRKDEFMSIASHELKTPITTLKGSLQLVERLLQRNGGDPALMSFVERANKQTFKLTELVNDLLDVTKIQEGKMQLNLTRFDIADMIGDCVSELISQDIKHKVTVAISDHGIIDADRSRIEQVMHNFMNNAIKYSPENKGIAVSCRKDADRVCVAVRDQGIGIPSEKQPFVFDRFYRVSEAATAFSGLGLGLYICAQIIERHGGKIGLVSQPGEGSTFWFSLPCK